MTVTNLLNTTINTERLTQTVDSGGSVISSFSENLTVNCRVQPLTGAEPVLAGRKYTFPVYAVYCSPDADITMKDRVVYGGDDFEIIDKVIYPSTYMKLIISKTD